MNYGYYDHMSGWAIVAMSVGSLLLWVALVLGTVALLRHLRATPFVAEHPDQLLAARYARGEIDEDEYHHRRDTLRRSGASV